MKDRCYNKNGNCHKILIELVIQTLRLLDQSIGPFLLIQHFYIADVTTPVSLYKIKSNRNNHIYFLREEMINIMSEP